MKQRRRRIPTAKTGPTAKTVKRCVPLPPDRHLQMEDIARLAGVSVSTVSRALSGSALVNEETRIRIEELARSLNYSINVGARNFRLQSNRTVAVVLPYDALTRQHVSDPFFVSMLGSLADALTERGYDLLLERISADQLYLAGDLPRSGRAIGAILIGQWRHHEQLNELAFRRSPVVVWGAQLPQQLYCTVGSDNVAGGARATAHLIETGRRRIAFFGDTELPEVARRFEGYQRSHTQHGLKIVPGLVRQTPFVDGSAEQAVADLIEQNIRFDAVFASSDLLAIGAINALRSRGRAVPKEVAVVGYDDIELARYYHPSLTTIRQPVLKGGAALVDALLQLVAGQRPKPQILPTELIIRESSVS